MNKGRGMSSSENNISSGLEKSLIGLSSKLDAFLSFMGKIGAWCAIPLIAIIIFDIITRRFFVLGSTKLQEMEWHLHAALFLLALGYGYLRNSHVRIEIIRERFSIKTKAWLEIIGVLFFVLPYSGLIIYFGLDFASRSYDMSEISSALTGLSHRWIIKSFIPVGMLFLWLAGIAVLLRNIVYLLGLKKNNKDISDPAQSLAPELHDPTEELKKQALMEETK